MDRSLVDFRSIAKNFLSTSPRFEPYIPDTQQNALQGLKILGELSHLTAQRLTQLKATLSKPKEPPPTEPTQQKTIPDRGLKPETLSQDSRAEKHAALAQALEALRKSRRPFRSGRPGIYSPIIRSATSSDSEDNQPHPPSPSPER